MQTLTPLAVPNTTGAFSAVLDLAGLTQAGEVTFAVPGAAPAVQNGATGDGSQVWFTTNPSATDNTSAVVGPLLTGPTPVAWPPGPEAPRIPCRYVILQRVFGTTTGLTMQTSGQETTGNPPATYPIPTQGAALADASITVTRAGQFSQYTMPPATMTASRAVSLPSAAQGAQLGDVALITRQDTTAYTLTITNGGPGTGNLFVMPVSKANFDLAWFDGTNWHQMAGGVQ